MKPPESTVGRVGWSLGILALGSVAGGVAGALYMPVGKNVGRLPATSIGAAAGAMGGLTLTALGALAALEFVDGEWVGVQSMTALIGGGLVGAGAVYGIASELGLAKELATPAGAPALSPSGGGGGTNYSASLTDSGKTLNMASGDTLTLVFPAPSDVGWTLSATSGLVSIQSQSTSGGQQTVVLVAGSGSGQVQATPPGGGAVFSINVNVVS